ncbi:MAG: hypothetical protein NZL98_03625, partial [Anaerolineales bacterium]|nr:hypothetical protein [Anaerolineales bacterium]
NKRILIVLSLLMLWTVSACAPKPVPDLGCAKTIDGLRRLRADLVTPDHLFATLPVENGSEFDPNTYFTVFNHLSMEEGYVLDFVYTYNAMGGSPTLFARRQEWEPFNSWADVRPGMDNYLYHVRTDGTPEGYVQFVILAIMAEQFYLDWHANYNDMQVVCNRQTVQALVKSIQKGEFGARMSKEAQNQALSIQPVEPSVVINEDTVEVQVITFTKWGGFYRKSFILQRTFPHYFLDVKQEVLVPYNCGIAF